MRCQQVSAVMTRMADTHLCFLVDYNILCAPGIEDPDYAMKGTIGGVDGLLNRLISQHPCQTPDQLTKLIRHPSRVR